MILSGLPAAVAADVLGEIRELLSAQDIEPTLVETILHEPEVHDVDRVARELRGNAANRGCFLLAIGGGAAIDLAKAAAVVATNRQSPTVADYLENVGRGLKIVEPPLPVLAMPTTAGTGAEATRNAVISSYDPPFKKSLRDDRILPRIALVDPELTVSVPPDVTAASGMDAITQLIESYISRKAQPIPQALAVQGLRLAVPAIAEAVENGRSRPARERMSHAALLSGMALANSGLGLAHGVAPALGIHCRVPHGMACAVMLPAALRINRDVRQAELATLARHVFGVSPAAPDGEAVDRPDRADRGPLPPRGRAAAAGRPGRPPRSDSGPREKLAGAEHERQSPRRVGRGIDRASWRRCFDSLRRTDSRLAADPGLRSAYAGAK